jgi:hypothetical protein
LPSGAARQGGQLLTLFHFQVAGLRKQYRRASLWQGNVTAGNAAAKGCRYVPGFAFRRGYAQAFPLALPGQGKAVHTNGAFQAQEKIVGISGFFRFSAENTFYWLLISHCFAIKLLNKWHGVF